MPFVVLYLKGLNLNLVELAVGWVRRLNHVHLVARREWRLAVVGYTPFARLRALPPVTGGVLWARRLRRLRGCGVIKVSVHLGELFLDDRIGLP
jgi:hypothetical protein